MKIFHIVEEVSEKNNSIVSVTKKLLTYEKVQNSKIIIPSTNSELNLKKGSVKKIKIFKNLFKYRSEVRDFLEKTQPDIIHIHGLWRPIHLFFVFVSHQMNIPIIIQPHGMLLDEAIKTKSKFTYLVKILIIKIYNHLLKNANFIAVTKEEKKSILKYFRSKNISIIPNPFDSTYKVEKNLKKNISYFGRFSPHKNLDLIVESFLSADLDKEWKLIIYGIDDDNKYKSKIHKIISQKDKYNRIIIKKPIFDKNLKFKKMSENYLNILMSKSEILSLTVLEGLSVGTKSLVNSNIKYPSKISNLLYFSKPKKQLVSSKMQSIAKKFSNNFKIRNNIKDKFKKIYNLTSSKVDYEKLIKKSISIKTNFKEIDFFNISVANGLNSFLVPFLVVIYGIIKPSVSAEIGIVQGTIIYLTQVFSSNSRAILLNEKNEKYFENFVSFRIIISFIIVLIFVVFFRNNLFIEESFHTILTTLILFSWVNEITLVFIEKNKLKLIMKVFIIFSSLFYLVLTFNILLDAVISKIIIFTYLFFHIFILNYFFDIFKIINLKYKISFLYQNIMPFFSTLSNTFSVLFWRYSILFFVSKEIAGLIFAIFSIASFPGTFYNNILGQTVLRQKRLNNIIKKYENYFYSVFILILLLSYFFINNYNVLQIDTFIINTLFWSLLGTIIMIISLRKRHNSIFRYFKNRDQVFKRDIIYSLSILPIIVVLYNVNGIHGISFAYLLSAIISFLFYSFKYDKYN